MTIRFGSAAIFLVVWFDAPNRFLADLLLIRVPTPEERAEACDERG